MCEAKVFAAHVLCTHHSQRPSARARTHTQNLWQLFQSLFYCIDFKRKVLLSFRCLVRFVINFYSSWAVESEAPNRANTFIKMERTTCLFIACTLQASDSQGAQCETRWASVVIFVKRLLLLSWLIRLYARRRRHIHIHTQRTHCCSFGFALVFVRLILFVFSNTSVPVGWDTAVRPQISGNETSNRMNTTKP